METRGLGRTGLSVSVLGLGGHAYLAGDDEKDFCLVDQRVALFRYLVSEGLTFFDTMWPNEVRLLAETFRRAGIGPGLQVAMQYANGLSQRNWRGNLRREVESRLEIMGYSSAPLFAVGVGNVGVPYSEIVAGVQALDALKAEGIVDRIGIACHQTCCYPLLARLIDEEAPIDYLLVRFNWKHAEARVHLFESAARRDVGLILMKVFCWDRGPRQWHRRISVFEPLVPQERIGRSAALSPAQRCLIWTLRQCPSAIAVCGMNAMWEAEQNVRALDHLDEEVDTSDFEAFAARLWTPDCVAEIARSAESPVTRRRALDILKSF
ncbi:hypothetical protein JW916_00660 [Candidatus Sumerlaeota bacterium]|nr:hypothetical protein [Candidatus Sumerlaeota bacterium]